MAFSNQPNEYKELQKFLPDFELLLGSLKAKESKMKVLNEKGNLETLTRKKHSKRNMVRIDYEEEALSDDDDYLFCVDCDEEYKGDCPSHSPLLYYPNSLLPKDGSEPERAYKTFPKFLSISSSGIKGAGLGVWTEVGLPKGLVFGPYEGVIVQDEKEAGKSGYCWHIKKRGKTSHFIDAVDVSRSNWLRFVNCATMESRQNLIAFQYKGEIFYRTYKHVPDHCELLVWYGDEYASDMNVDIKDDFPDQVFDVHVCKNCTTSYVSKALLQAHIQKKHKGRLSEFANKCQFCCYSTDLLHDLKRHLLIHTDKKSYQCPECLKRFAQKVNLKNHLLTIHEEDRPRYPCHMCSKSCNSLSNLAKHRRTHFQDKPFECPTCGSTFKDSTNLQKHKRVHTGQKPYRCSFCDFKFACKSNLNKHVVHKHTRDFPHRCPTCRKGFVRPQRLQKHLRYYEQFKENYYHQ